MPRGLQIDLRLRSGLTNEAFVAEALGNLAAYRLARQRNERLEWQVLRVDGSGGHHYRLVVRHPERVLDLGIGHELRRLLAALSKEDVASLRAQFLDAERSGLKPVPLRHVHETVDLWHDHFWDSIG